MTYRCILIWEVITCYLLKKVANYYHIYVELRVFNILYKQTYIHTKIHTPTQSLESKKLTLVSRLMSG